MTAEHGRLEVDQRVRAPIRAVWDAWTTERGLARWWWSGWDDTTYAVDATPGGRYRIEVPSVGIAVSGEFLALEPPGRLEMSWVWTDDDGDGPAEHVVVELRSDGDDTLVRVVHTGPWTTPEPAANYLEGWKHVLEQLAATR